jgi:hypothetical protein
VPAVSVLSANAADPDRPGRRCRVCVTVPIRVAWSRASAWVWDTRVSLAALGDVRSPCGPRRRES